MQIEVHNFTKVLRNTTVLNCINATFESGNIYGLIGKNGSGKTMLLRAISGLIRPTDGYIEIDKKLLGKDISFPPEAGIIIEKPEFLGYMSGLENLKFLSDIRGLIDDKVIIDYMTLFDLDPTLKKPVRKYSLGMKQKLGIIQAIMEVPQILILDEPFNALDENSVITFREFLRNFKNEGKLAIITSHNSEDIKELCNMVYKMDSGNLVPAN